MSGPLKIHLKFHVIIKTWADVGRTKCAPCVMTPHVTYCVTEMCIFSVVTAETRYLNHLCLGFFLDKFRPEDPWP